MDNKEEKTFADLFSSMNNDSEKDISNTDGTTFNNLAPDLFSGNDDFLEKVNEQVNDNLNIDDNNKENSVTFGNFFSNFNEEKVDVNINNKVNEDEAKEKNEFIDEVNALINVPKNEQLNNFTDISNLVEQSEEKPIVENSKENLFFNNEISISTNIDIKDEVNPFFENDKVNNSGDIALSEDVEKTEEQTEKVIQEPDNYKNSQIENIVEITNPFFGENDESNEQKLNISNENSPFLNDKNEEVVDNAKQSILAKETERKEEKKVVTESVSPFFQDSDNSLDKIEQNILGSKISFDQTKKVNSKVDKIDLSGTKNFNVKLEKNKVPLIKFLIGVMSYAFFIFLVLILVTLLAYVLDIKIRAAKGDYSAPKFNAYVVLTGSMLPEIQVKDVVVTKKVEADTLKVGDIITFASSDSRFAGTIITHRILKKNQDVNGNITFQTKGDNNNVADSALVQPNNIYGKVILKIPKLGYLQDFLATQGGWIIVILLPCVTVISYDVVKLVKGLKRKKNKIKVIK